MPFSSLELHLPSLYLAGLGFLLSTNLNKVLGTGSWGWEWSSPGIDAEMDKTIFQARSGRAPTSEQHRHKRLDTIGILRNSSRPKPLLLNFSYPTNMLCVFSLVGHYSLHMRRPCSSTWMRTVAATWRSRNSRRAMLSCKYSSWSRTGCHKHWNMLEGQNKRWENWCGTYGTLATAWVYGDCRQYKIFGCLNLQDIFTEQFSCVGISAPDRHLHHINIAWWSCKSKLHRSPKN